MKNTLERVRSPLPPPPCKKGGARRERGHLPVSLIGLKKWGILFPTPGRVCVV